MSDREKIEAVQYLSSERFKVYAQMGKLESELAREVWTLFGKTMEKLADATFENDQETLSKLYSNLTIFLS